MKRIAIAVLAVILLGPVRFGHLRNAAAEDVKPVRVDRFGDALPAGALLRLGTARLRQEDARHVAFSPDGERVASLSLASGRIALWERKTGRLIREFEETAGDERRGCGLAFSPDGTRLASVGCLVDMKQHRDEDDVYTAAVWLWDAAKGKNLWSAKVEGQSDLQTIAFSPDGSKLATGGGPFLLWDVATGKELRRFGTFDHQATRINEGLGFGASGSAGPVAFSPDGTMLAGVQAQKHLIEMWDVRTGDSLGSIAFDGREFEINSLFVSADGRQIVSGGFRLDEEMRDRLFSDPLHSGSVVQKYCIPEIRYRDVQTGKCVRTFSFNHPTGGIGAFSLSKDQKKLAVRLQDEVWIWDAEAAKLLKRLSVPGQIGVPCLSSDAAIVATPFQNTICLWDTASGGRIPDFVGLHCVAITLVRFAPDGRTIYTAGSDGRLTAWDASTGALRYQNTHGTFPWIDALDVSADGRWIVTGGVKERTSYGVPIFAATLWDARTGVPVRDFYDKRRPLQDMRVAVSPDARLVAIRGTRYGDDHISGEVWELASGRKVIDFPKSIAALGERCLGFSSDAKSLIFMGNDSRVLRWNVASGAIEKEFVTAEDPAKAYPDHYIRAVAIPADYQTLVAAEQRALYTWDLKSGELLSAIDMPDNDLRGQLADVAVSRDGRLLAVVDLKLQSAVKVDAAILGSTIRIFDRRTGKELQCFDTGRLHRMRPVSYVNGYDRSIDFSPDGSRLAGVVGDGSVLIWDLSPARRRLK